MKLVGALVGQSLPKTRGSARDGAGRVGTDPSGDAKSKADVRAPTTERRQHPGDMRKRVASNVRLERARKGGREGVDGKLRVRQVGLEVGEDVVAVVAVRVAVDLPAYAPGLELLRHGGPGEGAELRQT